MGDSITAVGFFNSWIWIVFVSVGLLMIFLELIVGVETSLDLVIIGSAFILAGLVTLPFKSWPLTLIVTTVICIAYIGLGRRYVHRRIAPSKLKTNIDAIIGIQGIVLKDIAKNVDGLAKVRNERWRARAEENIKKGDEIVVTGVRGVTLIVEKTKGGKQK